MVLWIAKDCLENQPLAIFRWNGSKWSRFTIGFQCRATHPGNKQSAHDGIISRTKYIFDSGNNTLLWFILFAWIVAGRLVRFTTCIVFALCLHVEFLLILLWVNSPWHSKLAICFPFGHETTEVVSPGCQCLDYSFFQTWRKNVSTTVLQSKVRTKGCTTMGDQIS